MMERIKQIDEQKFEVYMGGCKVTVQRPKHVAFGNVLYGFVASFSSEASCYDVVKYRIGGTKHSYRCGCKDNIFRRRECNHIRAFKLAEVTLREK